MGKRDNGASFAAARTTRYRQEGHPETTAARGQTLETSYRSEWVTAAACTVL